MGAVQGVDTFNIPALHERVLLGMHCLAKIGAARRLRSYAGGFRAMRHTSWYTVVACTKYASSVVYKHCSNLKFGASSSTR